MKKYYYHFTSDKLRDGRPIPPIGEWLEHVGEIEPCERGLHASEHPYDALSFAPGNKLHLVELGDLKREHGNPVNKVVSNRRKIIATVEAESLLRKFARECALSCLKNWNTPVPQVVRDYLETGDEKLRSAVESAARSAAWSAAESRAWSAAWSAAESAAWSAAESAARSAAWSAARSVARSAAWSAAWSAARSAAWSAVESAADSAARSAQRESFKSLVDEAFRS